jgi:hypothetical protein
LDWLSKGIDSEWQWYFIAYVVSSTVVAGIAVLKKQHNK